MKKTALTISILALSVSVADAQSFYTDAVNSEMLRSADHRGRNRKEIIIPQVNGLNVYKADLHTHSVFSDGSVLPDLRVTEAWVDGLDVMAVTEHIEYRPHESKFLEYFSEYTDPKKTKEIAINKVDLNQSVREAQKAAERYGMTIIPGTEITRSGTWVGHFNALFTTDNNTVYAEDHLQAIRNAKAQGALVMHNHPGWTRKNIDFTETEKAAYEEGLIDGVEVMNSSEIYPGIIDRVREYGQFIAANTDVHGTTALDYLLDGSPRPMTLIFAKDRGLDSIKEALVNDLTLAYGYGILCGSEQLLSDLFKACVSVKVIRKGADGKGASLMLTNNSSIPFRLSRNGGNPFYLDPFTTVSITGDAGEDSVKVKVVNMFCSKDINPEIVLSF